MNLLCAVMFSKGNKWLDVLVKEFGSVNAMSKTYDFNFTDYYENEFGKDLKKVIVIFDKEISKSDLVSIREKTSSIEEEFSKDGKRTVNIDPGYVSCKEVVLATKKYRSFKERLGGGVYSHKVLEFRDGKIISFHHTFADYKADLVKQFILSLS